ncbi:DHH family phosphoesterase [Prochlorothrix hollandica]|uniref:Exopolyphosphatase n=1 Tax=Prochlorothrix hollandica PCC 9006 = CALU 1027 TaxID=317619 RepID=A0A0M2Q2M2_PROHO|nr:exopolyphosphatase [Prochlorothrix hollandica]KKJ00837.1 exopolyphosphatase [Prochlorothrix hollandica PCC 9006 = CALU 1027]
MLEEGKIYRLVTRSDFDGLVCAILLKDKNLINEIVFVHPKDMQDGKINITNLDITTNLPYVPGVAMAFDHHLSETIRNQRSLDNHIIDPNAPSATRVVYDYLGGAEQFPDINSDMLEAVDKSDSAQFSLGEILNPSGWVLLNFLMDARTGLGRFKDFRVSNYNLMMQLIDFCKTHSIDQILSLADVKERVDLYFEQETLFKEQIRRCAQVHQNVVVLDLRNEETIYAGNRFLVYALFPDCNISVHILWGLKQQNTVFAVGKSIIDRTSQTNIGELMLEYGGGGHENAGTCQVDHDQSDRVLQELVACMVADG